MSEALWIPALQWGLFAILMAVVMGWLQRSRLRARLDSQRNQLVLPVGMLAIGLVCMALFAAILVLSNIYPDPTKSLFTDIGFGGFALLGLVLVLEFFLNRHDLTPDGIISNGLFRRRGGIRWQDVRRITCSTRLKWFKVEAASGKTARISAMHMGLPAFAKAVLLGVNPSGLD